MELFILIYYYYFNFLCFMNSHYYQILKNQLKLSNLTLIFNLKLKNNLYIL